jgi:hypothetical protein
VHDRPVLVIGSVEITPTWFFVLFLFIVIGAFGLGILFWQKRQGRVSRRVFIAEHDAQGILEHINKDLEKLSKELKDSSGKNNEINTNLLVSNLKESVKKMQKYVIGDIEDITKK